MASPTPITGNAPAHFVQFYKADEPLLNRNVGRFLWDGLLRGNALLVIAGEERRASLGNHLARLGADVPLSLRRRQLAMLDAREMLDRFMVNGLPDWHLFHATISEALGALQSRADDNGVTAYGEMVGVLWDAGEHAAAVLLEDYWNKLLHVTGISLFCGYPIDVFGSEFQVEQLQAVRCAHSCVIPAAAGDGLRSALHLAMDDVLGQEAGEVRLGMPAQESAACTEDSILWLWKNLPDAAAGILACARQHYQAAQSRD